MSLINQRVSELFKEFEGFPNKKSVVRSNQKNDAFCLYVLEVLLKDYHGNEMLTLKSNDNKELIKRSIVPPPDNYIDIFFEEQDADESTRYHVIQVKNTSIAKSDIDKNFTMMEKSINEYISRPNNLNNNLKEIIKNTEFDRTKKNDIIYYVVHRGDLNYIKGQKNNQKIITEKELIVLQEGKEEMCVPQEYFKIDTANNFIVNNYLESGKNKKNDTKIPESILCNLNGYDLGVLSNKYIQTTLGKNILYGQNLREALGNRGKTYNKMIETVRNEPELFLYYNNGITILANSFDSKTESDGERVELQNFSIINGAQTTSTLGQILRQAEMDGNEKLIENLKKVHVLTKVYKIDNKLKNHEKISEKIKIFTNTQTPLSSRDMVSIRSEQIELQRRLYKKGYPSIYMFIKKGERLPDTPRTLIHQRCTNEELAQFALSAFFSEPFNAKDKKAKLFDDYGQEDYTLNELYHKLFSEEDGKLHKKSNLEIDEMLFIKKLHDDSKKKLRSFYKGQLDTLNQSPLQEESKESRERRKQSLIRNQEIANVSLLYNICCYYRFKANYESAEYSSFMFDYKSYYDSKLDYKKQIIEDFTEIFYSTTIEIIHDFSGAENINNWVRSKNSQPVFLDELSNILNGHKGIKLKEKYEKFTSKYRTVKID